MSRILGRVSGSYHVLPLRPHLPAFLTSSSLVFSAASLSSFSGKPPSSDNNHTNNHDNPYDYFTSESDSPTGQVSFAGEETNALESELTSLLAAEASDRGAFESAAEPDASARAASASAPPGHARQTSSSTDEKKKHASPRVVLERLDRPPARFDLLTNSLAYCWRTTAQEARRVCGPMREWAAEMKYRTGVHLEFEPVSPERLTRPPEDGGYATAEEVELIVYLFGSELGVRSCQQLMETVLTLDEPAYVRLGIFRRVKGLNGVSKGPHPAVEWLMLRRINRELRPPDIPPISLKLPGKWTFLYEPYKEAAIRSLWEETGIPVRPAEVFPTARLMQSIPAFYWRVPVYYFIAELPEGAEVRGPQVTPQAYLRNWDPALLARAADPIDRAWADYADPETGCAWMPASLIDELQRPLRGEQYMATRYTPPPYANLPDVLGFEGTTEDAVKPLID